MKHIEVLCNKNLIATAPLFPAAPPNPVLTLSTLTSLINICVKVYNHNSVSDNAVHFMRLSQCGLGLKAIRDIAQHIDREEFFTEQS